MQLGGDFQLAISAVIEIEQAAERDYPRSRASTIRPCGCEKRAGNILPNEGTLRRTRAVLPRCLQGDAPPTIPTGRRRR